MERTNLLLKKVFARLTSRRTMRSVPSLLDARNLLREKTGELLTKMSDTWWSEESNQEISISMRILGKSIEGGVGRAYYQVFRRLGARLAFNGGE